MVDALVSGASVERRASSSLVLGTKEIEEYEFAVMQFMLFFVLMYLLPAVPSFCHSDKLYFQWAWDCCLRRYVCAYLFEYYFFKVCFLCCKKRSEKWMDSFFCYFFDILVKCIYIFKIFSREF